MRFTFWLFIVIQFFISCNKIGNKNIKNNSNDTIKKPENISVEKKCLDQVMKISISVIEPLQASI